MLVQLQGCLLVFSLKKEATFAGLNYWLEEIKAVSISVTVLQEIAGYE